MYTIATLSRFVTHISHNHKHDGRLLRAINLSVKVCPFWDVYGVRLIDKITLQSPFHSFRVNFYMCYIMFGISETYFFVWVGVLMLKIDLLTIKWLHSSTRFIYLITKFYKLNIRIKFSENFKFRTNVFITIPRAKKFKNSE